MRVFVYISNHTALCLYYNDSAVDGEQDQTWKLSLFFFFFFFFNNKESDLWS